ncbi:Transcription initiation factor IIB [Mortierella antarctica]|nr:Transcription initiation factor IIB [Mortierella antarctica]
MAATDRPHPAQQEHWRGLEYEAALADRAAYEMRPMPPPEHQQPRPLSTAPGPEAFAAGQQQDQRFEHHRSPSGAMLREDPTDPRSRAVKYLPPDPRSHPPPPGAYPPHERAPVQRPPSAMEAELRQFPQDPSYPQPAPQGHNPRSSPFISHERRESYPLHPQQPPPMNAPQSVHSPMERARIEEMHQQPHPGQPPYETPSQPRHPSALHAEAVDPQLHQHPDQRHPGMGSPRAQHAQPTQHPGYPLEAHPPTVGERPPYPQQGYSADPHMMRHGPDGPRPEEIHHNRGSFSYPAPPHPRPPRESAPSREGLNTNDPRHQGPDPGLGHRKMDSLQEPGMRLAVDPNGFQSPEQSGRPRNVAQVAPQPIAQTAGQMQKHAPHHSPDQFNRSSMTSPMEGVSRDGQHAGKRSISPEGTKGKKGRKSKPRPGMEYSEAQSDMLTADAALANPSSNVMPDTAPKQQQQQQQQRQQQQQQQQQPQRRVRKPRTEQDREIDLKDAKQRSWNLSDQDLRPFPQFPPGSVEEFEHQQRLQQQFQLQQRQQQQQQQQPLDPQPYQHAHQHPPQSQSRHEHSVEYNDPGRQAMDPSIVAAADRDAHRVMAEKAVASPVTVAPGKEPETVQNLEAAVANALVNIQHEGRFHSPDARTHMNGSEAHKRPRFEPPDLGTESHPDNPHRRPYSREDEQETAIILQDMLNHRQERLSNEGTVQHSVARGHQQPSPEFKPGHYTEHRGPYQQYGGHPQGEHPPIDPRQLDDHPMPHDPRTQVLQRLAPHSQPQLMPPQGRDAGYVRPEPFAFDPHQGMGPEDGSKVPGVKHRNRSMSTMRFQTKASTRILVAAADGNRWGTNSPTQGMRDVAELPHRVQAYHQTAPQQQPHLTTRGSAQWTETPTAGHAHATMQHAYPQDMDMHHGSQTTKMEQDDATVGPSAGVVNKTKSKSKTKVKGAGKATIEVEVSTDDALNSKSEQAYDPRYPPQLRAPQDMSRMAMDESSAPKSRGVKSKVKSLLQSSISSQPALGQETDDKEMNGTYATSHPSAAQHTRPQRMDPVGEPAKVESSHLPTSSALIETKAPESLLFGSGMILVKKLPDNSSNGNRPSSSGSSSSSSEGSREFPPPQLSIKPGQDHVFTSDGSTPVSAAPVTVTTPLSASSSVKKKRSRVLLDSADQDQDGRAGSPRLQTAVKNEPTTPVAGALGAKGKAGTTGPGRGRKAVVSGSTDADIERSNQITRTAGGPAWMLMGLSSSSTTLSNNSDAASGSVAKGPNENLNNAGVRRRPPLPPSALLAENDKRKPKRIKIEVTDVRDGQRTLSSATDSAAGKQDGEASTGGSGRSGAEKGNGKRGGGATDPENERGNENREGDDDDEGEDEVMDEGGRSDSAGARKRRSPQDDDEDPGHGDGTANGVASRGQGRGSAGSLRKNMKRKSASTLGDASASNKRTKEKSKGAASLDPKGQGDSDESTGGTSRDGRPRGGRVRKNNKSLNTEDAPALAVVSALGATAAAAAADTESEIEYLPMEDDISCPHMFGIEDTDKEKETSDEEDEMDDDDETSKDEGEYRPGGGGLVISQKVIDSNGLVVSNGSKTEEAPDMQDPLQIQGREWVKKLAMPETAWEETFKTYERVKRLKELKNRQPVRKRDAILAAILYIVCRDQGSPRTFSEVCLASGVRRGDIGAYYRLMLRILEPSENATASARDTDAEAFMTRWCESLSLPPQVRQAAVHVFSLANTMNLTSGKCPSSVGAAAIYLCISSWNDARRMARCQLNNCTGCQIPFAHPGAEHDPGLIRKEHKDVAVAVGVVSATLMGCFRNLAPERERLVPEEFLKVAAKGVE